MQIAKPLLRDYPIAGYDFIVNDEDDKEELDEVPFDNDSGSDGVIEPIT